MPRGVRNRATPLPGYGGFSQPSLIQFDPRTGEAIRKMFDVNALSDFGIKFPFNNGSTTVLNQSSNTTITPVNGVLYYDELNISNSAVVTVATSPAFIFARKVSIAASCTLKADGKGGAGGVAAGTVGAGNTGAAGGNAAATGNAGQAADYGATTTTDPPQFYTAIATVGGGGWGGSR